MKSYEEIDIHYLLHSSIFEIVLLPGQLVDIFSCEILEYHLTSMTVLWFGECVLGKGKVVPKKIN
jgi:hypothetical protein